LTIRIQLPGEAYDEFNHHFTDAFLRSSTDEIVESIKETEQVHMTSIMDFLVDLAGVEDEGTCAFVSWVYPFDMRVYIVLSRK
jgi:hypothetical protein